MSERPTIIIYADPLLAPSMTFVRAQGMALEAFAPCFVGARKLRHGGLQLPKNRVVVINSDGAVGKLKEIPFKVFGFDPLFFRRVGRFHPVLLHAHCGPAALMAIPLARRLHVPLVATFHGSEVMVRDEFLACSHFGARVYRRRKAVVNREMWLGIAVSKFIRDQLLRQGFSAEKTIVHYIGVDTETFHPDPGIAREPIVLFTARLAPNKGCEYLIRAMEKVQANRRDVELVIIGDGPLRASLECLAKEKLRRFRFVGFQPQEVVKHWMNRAQVFSVPSVEDQSGASEGFGLVFAEAQAMGLPVVSFETGGIPEAVAHGQTGLLARERDWDALAHNIEVLLGNDAVWQRMSKAGRERVCALFDLKKQTALLEGFYREVIDLASSCHVRPG